MAEHRVPSSAGADTRFLTITTNITITITITSTTGARSAPEKMRFLGSQNTGKPGIPKDFYYNNHRSNSSNSSNSNSSNSSNSYNCNSSNSRNPFLEWNVALG